MRFLKNQEQENVSKDRDFCHLLEIYMVYMGKN